LEVMYTCYGYGSFKCEVRKLLIRGILGR
jgi:hypothetical protein